MSFKKRALQGHEWLAEAKRLPVHGTVRIYHGAESRPNLVIRNLPDRWVAWCHACHEGDVRMKELVRLEPRVPSQHSLARAGAEPRTPGPLAAFDQCTRAEQGMLLAHWHEKGVYWGMQKELFAGYSRQDCRAVYSTPEGLLGRDLTGHSKAKWYTYNREQRFATAARGLSGIAVVTEDLYSAMACAYCSGHSVYAALGTRIHPELVLELAKHQHVLQFWDGDDAGDDAAQHSTRQLDLLGIPNTWLRIPRGKDPKDLNQHELALILGGT